MPFVPKSNRYHQNDSSTRFVYAKRIFQLHVFTQHHTYRNMAKINFVRSDYIRLKHHTVATHIAISLRHFVEIQIGVLSANSFSVNLLKATTRHLAAKVGIFICFDSDDLLEEICG